jgi:hypothetical protein
MGVPISVSLIITTTTKTMDKADTPQDAFSADPKKPKFPALPAGDDIRFYVGELVELQARNARATVEDQVQSLNCFQSAQAGTPARVSMKEPVWIPSSPKGDTGRWKREVQYDSSIVLARSPTVDVGLIRCAVRATLACVFRVLISFIRSSVQSMSGDPIPRYRQRCRAQDPYSCQFRRGSLQLERASTTCSGSSSVRAAITLVQCGHS